MKTRLVVLMLSCGVLAFAAGDTATEDFDCSMPVILSPLIKEIRSTVAGEMKSISPPHQCNTVRTAFTIGDFVPDKKDEADYDKFIAVSYPTPGATFRLYVKNDMVMKMEQSDPDGTVRLYSQTITGKMDALNFADASYLSMTRETIFKIFANECILLKLKNGIHNAVVNLKITEDVDVGTIEFTDENLEYRFCYYKGKMENEVLILKTEQAPKIIFSLTDWKGRVVFANVYDNAVVNGFDCAFYANQGLKFYIPRKDRKYTDVITWTLNGESTRNYPWEVWLKQGHPGM